MEKQEKISTQLYILGLIIYLIVLGLLISKVTLHSWSLNIALLITIVLSGYHVILEGIIDTINESRRQHKFVPNVHILMTLGAIGAVLIGNFSEAALLILIFAGAHLLEDYAEGKSQREIKALLAMNPTRARRVANDGTIDEVSVEDVLIGDILQVQNGAQVPIDGLVIAGAAVIDESAINGESIPREKGPEDAVFAGTINGNSTFTMQATKTASDTVFAKILKLVDQSQINLSKTATKIKQIEPKYVIMVLILFPIVMMLGMLIFKWTLGVAFYRGIVFLIAASPCALAASAVPATLSAISNLAQKGVLFKGGSFLANLAELKTIAFDKTGTLTKGKPEVTDYLVLPDVDKSLLTKIIVGLEQQTNNPLAAAIVKHFKTVPAIEVIAETQIGKGVTATYQGSTYTIGKPMLFIDVDDQLVKQTAILGQQGKTVVYVAKDEQVVALIALMDTPNSAAKPIVDFFKEQNIRTVMITGDSQSTGEAVAQQIGLDAVVTNVLPEEKLNIINEQKTQSAGLVAMVGDGVNDAPALVNADIGVAMGDGTDVAIDVADVVLMKNDLTKFVYAYQVSKRLKKVVWQNICFSMLIVVLLVVSDFMGITNIGIGVLVHEGSTLLVILNGLRLLLDTK